MTEASPTAPDNAALDALFDRAACARLSEHPTAVSRSETPRTLLVIRGAELASLRRAMQLAPGPGPHCMCLGDMVLGFEDAAGRPLDTITLHHGLTLRWDGPWSWRDAAFADADGLIDWLAAHGVSDYAEQRARDRVAGEAHRKARERWLAAAPARLRERLPELERDAMGVPRRLAPAELDELLASLRDDRADDAALAAELLAWFGSGTGPWSGHPAYESLAEQLLLRLGTDAVMRAAEREPASDARLDGLARYFGSHELHRTRRSDTHALGEPLRSCLLERVRVQAIGDNHERLAAALRRPAPRVRDSNVIATHPDRALSLAIASGDRIFAVDGLAIVRFDPESDVPTPLLEREPMFADLAADDAHVYAALINEGTLLAIPHAGGEPIVLARGRGRPLSLRRSGTTLAWLDQPWINDPARAPHSLPRTIVCTLPTTGGEPRELARYEGSGWDLALTRTHAAWVRSEDGTTTIAAVPLAGGEPLTIVDEFDGLDREGGFVHLAAMPDELIVAVPTRSWLREGVELRRYSLAGEARGVLEFVAGRFHGIDADERGVALIVQRRGSVIATCWNARGRSSSLTIDGVPGPLIEPCVCADGVVFAAGPDVFRLAPP
ncbi:hypothetical protein ACNOYE_28645 [Nannocystaceae bacterium ST9]